MEIISIEKCRIGAGSGRERFALNLTVKPALHEVKNHFVFKSFRLFLSLAGLAGSGNIGARDWEPPVQL